MNPDGRSRDQCVLFLPATARDALTTVSILGAHAHVEVCRTFDVLLREMAAGGGAVLLPEEAAAEHNAELRSVLAGQAPWSDLPVLVLALHGADSMDSSEAVRTLGNVTLLERPVRVAALVSAVQTALRGRLRQYQIREHLADRARAEEALRLADRRKDEFIATLGHELRNPLAPLLMALQLLKTTGARDPVVTQVSAIMDRQLNHLVRLVDDLLEVSRITRGLVRVQHTPVDLLSVLRTAIETSRSAFDAARHTLDVELCADPVIVNGDAVRLTQVFANLLTNAAKYTDAGGHVRLRLEAQDGYATISVRDNGIGLAPDQIESVFDMFTQVDRSSRRAQGGLGIGLTLVRSLVHMHGGRVEARSGGLGCGSEFVVELPVACECPAPPDVVTGVKPFPRRRILVVDDNNDAAETLGALLSALGASVSIAHSGPLALAMVDTFCPDAVLLDIGMPGMDGFEVARRIRASRRHDGVLLIALTGWGQAHDQQRSHAAGFDHHVVKPLDIDRLRELFAERWPDGAVVAR